MFLQHNKANQAFCQAQVNWANRIICQLEEWATNNEQGERHTAANISVRWTQVLRHGN